MAEHLHIVALDAPSPPNYGGGIELYYKIPALTKMGIKVHLHYFNYKKERSAKGLEQYCESIHTYKRTSILPSLLQLKPFIVSSRINKELIRNLNNDDAPVLVEGIHCAGILTYLKKSRRAILRLHNDEAIYYQNLFRTENNLLRKLYFGYEYLALRKFQRKINKEVPVLGLSASDVEIFKKKYHISNTHFLPSFLPWQDINCKTGKGIYCLYQGNMEVSENIQAVKWLQDKVFSKLNVPFVIAGKSADSLRDKISNNQDIRFVPNPTDQQLSELIQNAQINILPSFNETGVKLKLLHALFEGRYCITNTNGIKGSGITDGVHMANSAEEMIILIKDLMDKPFTQEDINLRKQVLKLYNNDINAEKLIAIL